MQDLADVCSNHHTTLLHRRRCRIIKVPYLTQIKEKKAVDSKYMDTLY